MSEAKVQTEEKAAAQLVEAPVSPAPEDSGREPPRIRLPGREVLESPHRIVVRKDPPEKRVGNIIVPETAKKKSRLATVEVVYEGCPYASGQRILTAKYKGTPLELPGCEGLDIILERDIYLFLD